ncbi:hypothetical protein [Larkinella punicea]|uniref:Uncharacterized protein n=1 Tax=Larkinella punicea TaxID=2315727 RepID=A0A368JUW7_9BACT|nr:hypothetical protein [Larkinella punicea]RCR69991.1 hypothetical protein DUE52_09190 [Larkinella punicea]
MARRHRFIFLFFLLSSPVFAQQITMRELIDLTCLKTAQFDSCLFRKGFLFKNCSESVANPACIYEFQAFPYISSLNQTSALIQYICNGRLGLLNFQQPSKTVQAVLRRELIGMGFQPAETVAGSELTERQIFYKDKIVVSFKPADSGNGIAGNYSGYSISIHHERRL